MGKCDLKCKMTENRWRLVLLIVSIFVLLMAIVIVILAAKVKTADVFQNADKNVDKVGDAAFFLMIIFACGALLVAIVGALTAWKEKWYCLYCFGGWSLVIGIVYLIAGIILFVIGNLTDDMLNSFCYENKYQNTKYFADTIRQVDLATANWTSAYMCTSYCPCPRSNSTTNYYLNKWKSESDANYFNRTLQSSKTGYASLVTINSTQTWEDSYTSFYDCYLDVIADNSQSSLKQSTIYEVKDSLLDFLNFLEKNFACNGICKPGLFFFFQDVTLGPPTDNCIEALQDTFQENTWNIAAALIVSCFFTLLAFAVQYSLWSCKRCKKGLLKKVK